MSRRISSLIFAFAIVFCFAAAAFADSTDIVRPSVEVKDVSVVTEEIPVSDPEALDKEPEVKKVAGMLLDIENENTPDEEKTVVKYYELREVYLTPYAQRNQISYVTLSEERKGVIKQNLELAYDKIYDLHTLGEINEELEIKAKEIDENFNSWVFVASDIFDISLMEDEEARLAAGENLFFRLTVKLTHPAAPGEKLYVMHCPQTTKEWKLLPDERVHINDDQTVTLEFENLCPVIIMSVQPERMAEYEEYEKDLEKGHCKCPSWCPLCRHFCIEGKCYCLPALIIIICLILVVAFAAYRFIFDKDKKKKRKDE